MASAPVNFGDYNLQKQGYDPWVAYGQAKTANIYMANEIERRYAHQGLHGLSLHSWGDPDWSGRSISPLSMMGGRPQATGHH